MKYFNLSILFFFCLSMTAMTLQNRVHQDAEPWIAPKEADKLTNPYTGKKKAAKKGQQLFESMCWQCHGMKGDGNGPGAAAFPLKPADLGSNLVQNQTDGALVWKITTGRGNMRGYKDLLSVDDRWRLVTYIRAISKVKKE